MKRLKVNREDQKNTFGEEVKIADIAPFYEKLVCSECKKKYPEILDKNNNIIYEDRIIWKHTFINIRPFNFCWC